MAACNRVRAQLVRGLWGFGFLTAAAFLFQQHFWLSVALVAVAAVPLRGCPLCWSFGLYEAWRISQREKQKGDPPSV